MQLDHEHEMKFLNSFYGFTGAINSLVVLEMKSLHVSWPNSS